VRLLPADPVARARAKLVLLGLFFAAPLLLAWLAYRMQWAPGTRSNYGELISPPRPLAGAPLAALRGKWVLVSFDAAACDDYCRKKLYFMRQLRRAQGKDQARVERLWLLTDAARPPAGLLADFEGTRVEPAGALAARFPVSGALSDHLYLVDPLGNLMMRYPREPDPSRMLKDLQRLLKVSGIG
jgi:hypothetical protein